MKEKRKYLKMITVIMLLIFIGIAIYLFNKNNTSPILNMIYIPKTREEDADFWKSLVEGAQAAANEFDVNLTMLYPDSENDYEGQKRCIQEAINQKPDAILLSPSSYTEITEMAELIVKADIKLILIDSAMDKPLQTVIVTTDNFVAGSKMGEFFKEHMPEDPQIGVIAHVRGASTAIEREKGFRSGLGEYEKYVKETVFCESDYERAYELTMKMLNENPRMNMLVGLNEYSAVGAARAVRDLGLTGKIQMVGFDNSIEEVQMLEAGIFRAIVIQKPYNMGYLGVESAVKAVNGKKVDSEVDSGSLLITKENIYTEENQKLLFPFIKSE